MPKMVTIAAPQYRVGKIQHDEDRGILHRSLTFPEQPGEFLMGRYGVHVPLCNIQADDDTGDISYRITDTVIQPPGVGRHHHGVDGRLLKLPEYPEEERNQCSQEQDGSLLDVPGREQDDGQNTDKDYQSERNPANHMGNLVIVDSRKLPVPPHDPSRSMHEEGERNHGFYADRERNPQQFLSDIGNHGHEKCRYCDLHPGEIIDILRVYCQSDKTYFKKDDDNILDSFWLDRKSLPCLFI